MELIKIDAPGEYKPVSDSSMELLNRLASNRERIDLSYSEKSGIRNVKAVRVTGLSAGPQSSYIQLTQDGIEMLIRIDAIVSINGQKL